MNHTEQFQGQEMELKFKYRWPTATGISGPCIPSLCSSLTSRCWERFHKPDHSDKWSTSPNNRLAPWSFAKTLRTAFELWLDERYWRGHHPDRLQLPQSQPDVTGTLIGPRGPESASLPPQSCYPSFAGPQHSCPETTRRTHARGTNPPQKKIERTWRRFLESLPVPAGRWQPSLQKCGRFLSNNIANDENQCCLYLHSCINTCHFILCGDCSLFLKRIMRDTTEMVEHGW